MPILLTIPCYNEAGRLPAYLPTLLEQIALSTLPVNVEVVDDGSQEPQRDATERLVTELQGRHPFLMPLRKLHHNQGKGAAVRASWDAAAETHAWLAFVDADGSLSPSETSRFLDHCLRQTSPQTCFASRIQMLGHTVDRHYYRHLTGRIFATMVGTFIDRRVYDSQCGLKAIPSAHYRLIRPLLQENRFIFDVELLAALLHTGLPAVELTVNWVDVPGSKVHPIRDTLSMACGLLRIRRQRRGWPAAQIFCNF